MSRPLLAGAWLALTLGGALGTRLPGSGWAAWASIGLALAAVGLWAVSLGQRRTWWAPAALGVLVALLAVPTSPQAWLAGLPPLLVAAPAALFLHAAYRSQTLDAPRLPGAGRVGFSRHLLRFLPVALALAAVAVLPGLATLALPDRLASSFELRGALGPLAVAAATLAAILGGVWLRDALAPRGAPPTDASPPSAAAPEVEP